MKAKHCSHCGGRFGLVRYTAYRLGAIIQFCRKKCERDYYAKLHAQSVQHARWLGYFGK
jgi:ribosomal protein L24E